MKVGDKVRWQPSTTAPKTGRGILVYVPERQSTFAIVWGVSEGHWQYWGGGWDLFHHTFTHWMPLPDPPKESK